MCNIRIIFQCTVKKKQKKKQLLFMVCPLRSLSDRWVLEKINWCVWLKEKNVYVKAKHSIMFNCRYKTQDTIGGGLINSKNLILSFLLSFWAVVWVKLYRYNKKHTEWWAAGNDRDEHQDWSICFVPPSKRPCILCVFCLNVAKRYQEMVSQKLILVCAGKHTGSFR